MVGPTMYCLRLWVCSSGTVSNSHQWDRTIQTKKVLMCMDDTGDGWGSCGIGAWHSAGDWFCPKCKPKPEPPAKDAPTAAQIRQQVRKLLKNADLDNLSRKKVRQELQDTFGVKLDDQKVVSHALGLHPWTGCRGVRSEVRGPVPRLEIAPRCLGGALDASRTCRGDLAVWPDQAAVD